MTKNKNIKKEALPEFVDFAKEVYTSFRATPFHETYYRVLEYFAKGDIKKLIVSVPPQHGKSLGSSVLLPSYMLGLCPDTKIAIASYSASLASRFNRRVQRVIDSAKYTDIFPGTRIKGVSERNESIRTSNQVEIIGRSGELLSVGREGSLTGNEVDVFIIDDLYKDAMEANSPIIRDNCWEWYTSVVKTRLHNDSSELIVFTRWHDEDLIGTILGKEKYVKLESWEQIGKLSRSEWLVLNFEALKEGISTEVDPRSEGEALWPARHSVELLKDKRSLDPFRFDCMYQGRPSPKDGLLYGDKFKTYKRLPEETFRKCNYTDTADMGDDYLCSVCYETSESGFIYITDVAYSRESMEFTEKQVADMLNRNMTRIAYVESNNGGRGFARAVGTIAKLAKIEWFHQSGNKEARIITNSATVLQNIIMPHDWAQRWPDLYNHLITYRRQFKANRWHDAPDVLTGIVEKEIVDVMSKKIKKYGYRSIK